MNISSTAATDTMSWNDLPRETKNLIRDQYGDYKKYTPNPKSWSKWLSEHYDVEEK